MTNNKMAGHEETHLRRNTHPAAVAAAEVDAAVPDTHRHRLASLGKRPDQPIWTGLDSGGGRLWDGGRLTVQHVVRGWFFP